MVKQKGLCLNLFILSFKQWYRYIDRRIQYIFMATNNFFSASKPRRSNFHLASFQLLGFPFIPGYSAIVHVCRVVVLTV